MKAAVRDVANIGFIRFVLVRDEDNSNSLDKL